MQELEVSVSARELADWAAYWGVEPWGAERDNMHAAVIASLIFNANRGKDTEPRKMDDFMFREVAVVNAKETTKFVAALRALAKSKRK